jgi:hypothetical protein
VFSTALRLDNAPGGERTAPLVGFLYPPLGIFNPHIRLSLIIVSFNIFFISFSFDFNFLFT